MKIPISIEKMFEKCESDYKRANSSANWNSKLRTNKNNIFHHKLMHLNKMSKYKASKLKGYVL